MEDFARRFPAWNAAYQLHVNRGGPTATLSDAVRRTIWIGMLPSRERDDINRNRHLWTTAEQLSRHLTQLIHDRTSGPSPMLMPLDTDAHEDDVESVIDEDTGETMLYRIEVKSGKRF